MPTLYLDGDACPVKGEAYRVARRYAFPVVVVANATLRVPAEPLFHLEVRTAAGEVDDWIAERVGPGDVVVTADVPLAERCVTKGARVLGPKGHEWTAANVGEAVAMRDLRDGLRQSGVLGGGPSGMTPRDRSRFLSRLDEVLVAVRRVHPPAPVEES